MQFFIKFYYLLFFKIFKLVMFFPLPPSFPPSSPSPLPLSPMLQWDSIWIHGHGTWIQDLTLAEFMFLILDTLFAFSKPQFPCLGSRPTATCLPPVAVEWNVSLLGKCRSRDVRWYEQWELCKVVIDQVAEGYWELLSGSPLSTSQSAQYPHRRLWSAARIAMNDGKNSLRKSTASLFRSRWLL